MTLLDRSWHPGEVWLVTCVGIPLLVFTLVIVTAWLVVVFG